MKGKDTKLVALLSSSTFIMCDVFLVIIRVKECQTDVLTKVGTILLCSFVLNGISHHRKQYLPVSMPALTFTLKILVHKTMQFSKYSLKDYAVKRVGK